ncbi:LysM domain-containing protein [Rhodobacteraceae bacterium B1Z28]|uniref:LysM domain-containing protein n=2 Tax=Ruegeria haliotis TaxID=2747601 RepID=A0ABX2PXB0_9RHOB|nr:LysM domain-containing protein [Ruegeria haliotis]
MFEAGVVEATDFPPESRYHGVPTKTLVAPDGRQIAYLARRFVPHPEGFATQGYRITRQGERLDQIAAAAIGDPLGFWRLCDANGTVRAEELEVTGAEIRLTLPEFVPGPEEEL